MGISATVSTISGYVGSADSTYSRDGVAINGKTSLRRRMVLQLLMDRFRARWPRCHRRELRTRGKDPVWSSVLSGSSDTANTRTERGNAFHNRCGESGSTMAIIRLWLCDGIDSLMTPLIFQTDPKTSAKRGCSCSNCEKRCISGPSHSSRMVGIRS